ncbi:GNAT family N-acetyltransferase [Agilicoccus flavus]|uniref:GNAT family N-acetyltransferase n=1 Tax=Agilicoccus flavus TaxID=2775968 RepID=UPI001CF64636|nr:GNAT family N-acetyltransferase [Agilicoccus flavus]
MTTITPLTSADATAVHDLDAFAFAQDPTSRGPEVATMPLDWSRTFGARHEITGVDALAGVYTSFDLTLTVPGAHGRVGGGPGEADTPAGDRTTTLPLTGLSWVGVHPDVRRRGVLRSMIDHHLRDSRERGYALAGLTASEKGIYGRFGYGVATLDVTYTVSRGAVLPGPGTELGRRAAEVLVRLVLSVDDAGFLGRMLAIDASGGPGRSGFIRVPASFARAGLHDTPASRVGREPTRALVATRDGRDVGYALFAREPRVPGGGGGQVVSRVVHAHDDAALLALVARLSDLDLTPGVTLAGRSLDDAPLGWSGGPRDLDVTVRDGLWLRPVDVGAMLAGRGYAGAADVVLDVLDPTCPWNEGRWRLAIGEDGTATCEPTRDPADLRLGAAGIGPWYLGLHDLRSPVLTAVAPEAGGVVELRRGALRALARAASTGVAPLGGRGF